MSSQISRIERGLLAAFRAATMYESSGGVSRVAAYVSVSMLHAPFCLVGACESVLRLQVLRTTLWCWTLEHVTDFRAESA
jgi:hypothetical protein